VVQNVVTLSFAFQNLTGARDAYAHGRELRGLTVREDALDFIFSPEVITATVAAMLLLYAVLAFVVYRNRTYFRAGAPAAD